MGALDSPVRTGHDTVQCPVPAMSVARWNRPLDLSALRCTGQSGGTPDSPVWLTFSDRFCSSVLSDRAAVDRWWRWPLALGTPDSLVNFSRGRWVFPRVVGSLGAPAWALDTVRCTTGWCKLVLPHCWISSLTLLGFSWSWVLDFLLPFMSSFWGVVFSSS
jgi:hypothetical protein